MTILKIMSAIKFRGQDFAGMWHIGDVIHSDDDDMLIRSGCFSSFVKNETVGQFTGLNDKNGVEMFFDDVVRNGWGDIGRIVWYENSIRVDWGGGDIHYIDMDDEIEVIGNINDNPNLMYGGYV